MYLTILYINKSLYLLTGYGITANLHVGQYGRDSSMHSAITERVANLHAQTADYLSQIRHTDPQGSFSKNPLPTGSLKTPTGSMNRPDADLRLQHEARPNLEQPPKAKPIIKERPKISQPLSNNFDGPPLAITGPKGSNPTQYSEVRTLKIAQPISKETPKQESHPPLEQLGKLKSPGKQNTNSLNSLSNNVAKPLLDLRKSGSSNPAKDSKVKILQTAQPSSTQETKSALEQLYKLKVPVKQDTNSLNSLSNNVDKPLLDLRKPGSSNPTEDSKAKILQKAQPSSKGNPDQASPTKNSRNSPTSSQENSVKIPKAPETRSDLKGKISESDSEPKIINSYLQDVNNLLSPEAMNRIKLQSQIHQEFRNNIKAYINLEHSFRVLNQDFLAKKENIIVQSNPGGYAKGVNSVQADQSAKLVRMREEAESSGEFFDEPVEALALERELVSIPRSGLENIAQSLSVRSKEMQEMYKKTLSTITSKSKSAEDQLLSLNPKYFSDQSKPNLLQTTETSPKRALEKLEANDILLKERVAKIVEHGYKLGLDPLSLNRWWGDILEAQVQKIQGVKQYVDLNPKALQDKATLLLAERFKNEIRNLPSALKEYYDNLHKIEDIKLQDPSQPSTRVTRPPQFQGKIIPLKSIIQPVFRVFENISCCVITLQI